MPGAMELFRGLEEKRGKERLEALAQATARYGLSLDAAQREQLALCHRQALQDTGRVAIDGGILPELAFAFCDSPHVCQAEWAELLAELTQIFYAKKGESGEAFTDTELVDRLRWHFDAAEGGLAHLWDLTPEMLWQGPVWEPPEGVWEGVDE